MGLHLKMKSMDTTNLVTVSLFLTDRVLNLLRPSSHLDDCPYVYRSAPIKTRMIPNGNCSPFLHILIDSCNK